ncbi:hypothetical protein AARAC_005678 [Aspergillus arachidicola]|uniref:Uncharacterized protein n=1 Tax=Aspergillus arachidicola TaxID=656916 RepID=A0A2G7FLD3_9EURO|nr:hypothetical protein AARAC_005678 [Aspergillus arachidicola]
MADSIFDPVSNVTLMLCNLAARKGNTPQYPVGKARIENIGNIYFSIMMAVSLIQIAFSCQELTQGWRVDPMGTIILSLLILLLWLQTSIAECQLLIGVIADSDILNVVTYFSMTHHPAICAVDTARAYHAGPRLIVEVDVVMDSHEPWRKSHDISEDSQNNLESLPNVDRAFFHTEYKTSHWPEHAKNIL